VLLDVCHLLLELLILDGHVGQLCVQVAVGGCELGESGAVGGGGSSEILGGGG
jgi:hypothetical protein